MSGHGTEVKVANLPTCNFCTNLAGYDAQTAFGPWAYLCTDHFFSFSTGRLGMGYGQKLILEED